ncbi:hypothetical protein [Phaeodactylibacter luteus]|uniref:Uncharacterized protein n=1 Tax=Phaeodactylibacter luteus TaxID=1564516 RepID=A0A5C6RGJ9_9BACT|nr:hypothetical protein [Phaeodactylibacter luteus]TXB61476.1 hypothetical protein FRY97_18855 [Phaeodactylibacter luteus]
MELFIALLAGAATALIYGFTKAQQRKARKRRAPHPALDTQNTTNYNMEILEEAPLKKLTPEEANRMIEHWKRGGYIPSHREFYAVQRVLRREAKREIKSVQEES